MVGALASVASLLAAIAWPLTALYLVGCHRKEVSELLMVAAPKFKTAKRFKVGAFEVDSFAEGIEEIVTRAEASANTEVLSRKIPKPQFDAAQRIRTEVGRADLPRPRIFGKLREQVYLLAESYDSVRAEMPSSPQRTRRMNQLAAGMRALASAVGPLRTHLMHSPSAGKRLAAICGLQINPRHRYLRWLIERFRVEDQAFVLYQAALAVSQYVEKDVFTDPAQTLEALRGAIRSVGSFSGGVPDQNTLEILNESASELAAKMGRARAAD
jgi:hypothetical protein